MTAADTAATGSGPVGPARPRPFGVIPGRQVERVLRGRQKQIVELVEATYRRHSAGDSVNPPSYFLRFPDRPSARIIALPASIGGPTWRARRAWPAQMAAIRSGSGGPCSWAK